MADEPTNDAQEQQPAATEQAAKFEPITSQEELDRRIGPRLERERSKFADYDALKAAADELAQIKESQKTEAERTAERIAQAEAVAASIPAKVTESLKEHLVTLHEIDQETADLFLTAEDPERLLKQVQALVTQRSDKPRAPRPNPAQNGGATPPQGDWLRQQFTRT